MNTNETNYKVFCAVKAVIVQDRKFLLLKQELQDGTIAWSLPGGKVEYGEDPYQSLHREVREETGLEVTIEKPLGMWWFFRIDKHQVVCNTFLCTPKNSTVDLTKNPSSEGISKFEWVTKEDFLAGKYPYDHESLVDVIAQI